MALNNATILDQIRIKGSNDYQQRVPPATQAGVAATVRAVMSDRILYNEFVGGLVNRIGMTLIRQRKWENPLAFFKQGKLEYGMTIQEIGNDLIKAKGYELDAQTLLQVNRPESKVAYHSVNRQNNYPITINDVELRKAFIDEYGLNNYINSILEIPFTSDNYDEYNIMLNLIALYESFKGGFYKVQVPDVVTDTTGAAAKVLLTQIRAYMGKLKFLSAMYNKAAIPNHTDPADLVLLITPEIRATLDVSALATLFHIEKAEVEARIVEVDQFPIKGAQALLVDRSWFICSDYVYENTSFWNPETLSTTYWLHHWGVYSVSSFMNAILFTTEDPTVPSIVEMKVTGFSIDIIEDEIPTDTVVAGGVYDTDVTLTGSVTSPSHGVSLLPESFTYTISAYQGGKTPSAFDLSSKTYIDRLGKLHVQEDVPAGVVITINAISTYVDPSKSPIPGALTGTVTVTVKGNEPEQKPEPNYSITLNKKEITLDVGSTYTIIPTIESPDIVDIKWYSTNKDVATVNFKGEITAVSAGTCTIIGGIENMEGSAYDTCTVTVTQHEQGYTIGVTPPSATINVGESVQLTANAMPNGATVSWRSSNSKIATVTNNGLVNGVAKGNATIYGEIIIDGNVEAVDQSVVTVNDPITITPDAQVFDGTLKDGVTVTAKLNKPLPNGYIVMSDDFLDDGTATVNDKNVTITLHSSTVKSGKTHLVIKDDDAAVIARSTDFTYNFTNGE